jgi:hypothetical protein
VGIGWAEPWYAGWRATGEPVEQRLAQGAALHEALNASAPPVRFVPQESLPAGVPYERFVFDTRTCPVRPGLHDFFNGLVWLRFPRAKQALNALQANAIARDGIAATRGPVRDAITTFDENGALFDAPPELWDALVAREWRRLFVDLRDAWRDARLLVFGHALLEQLASPRKGLTAHVWREQCAMDSGADADAWLAARCTAGRLAAKPFTPLPVLGVPGWWPENSNFSFYDDSLVFRPRLRQNPP